MTRPEIAEDDGAKDFRNGCLFGAMMTLAAVFLVFILLEKLEKYFPWLTK